MTVSHLIADAWTFGMITEQPERQNFSGNLYDVMVSYQNAKTNTVAETKWYSNGYSEIPLAVHIDNWDGRESHTINVDYQTAVFHPKEADYPRDKCVHECLRNRQRGCRRKWRWYFRIGNLLISN